MNWIEEAIGDAQLSSREREALKARRIRLGLPPLTDAEIERYETNARRLLADLVAS